MESPSDPLTSSLSTLNILKVELEVILIQLLSARIDLKLAKTMEEAKAPMERLRENFKKFKTLTMDFQQFDFDVSQYLDSIIYDLDKDKKN